MARILIVNKFYYLRGGDCVAAISLQEMLEQKGHSVAIFSMQYPLNNKSEWDRFFPSEVNFSAGSVKRKLDAFFRLFYSREVKDKFERIIKEFNPDIVHLHNIHSYLSPLVAQVAYEKNIKVVWTLHDYKLICPAYSCLRDHHACELCYTDKLNVLKYRCVKHSLPGSLMALLEAWTWNRKRLQKYTTRFIAPSSFLKLKMVSAGFDPAKITVLHNALFSSVEEEAGRPEEPGYYCYVGRLSAEKGIENLLQVASKLPYTLKVVGTGDLEAALKARYSDCPHIEFLGQMKHEDVIGILQHALFSVLPSVCYENNPFSIIESLSVGTPVLGADIGGIPELIEEDKNGFLFEPLNLTSLETMIHKSFATFIPSYNRSDIKRQAQAKFSPDNYYDQLMRIYSII